MNKFWEMKDLDKADLIFDPYNDNYIKLKCDCPENIRIFYDKQTKKLKLFFETYSSYMDYVHRFNIKNYISETKYLYYLFKSCLYLLSEPLIKNLPCSPSEKKLKID